MRSTGLEEKIKEGKLCEESWCRDFTQPFPMHGFGLWVFGFMYCTVTVLYVVDASDSLSLQITVPGIDRKEMRLDF
jgi:hypothetical protein